MRAEGVENEITVTEEAVPFHAAAGWEVIEDEPEDIFGEEQAGDSKSSSEKSKSERPRSSAAKKKEQD